MKQRTDEVNCLHSSLCPKHAQKPHQPINEWKTSDRISFATRCSRTSTAEGGRKMNGLKEELWKIPWIRNLLDKQRYAERVINDNIGIISNDVIDDLFGVWWSCGHYCHMTKGQKEKIDKYFYGYIFVQGLMVSVINVQFSMSNCFLNRTRLKMLFNPWPWENFKSFSNHFKTFKSENLSWYAFGLLSQSGDMIWDTHSLDTK